MRLNRTKITLLILLFAIITNALVYFDIERFYLKQIISTIYLLTIPGFIILAALKVKTHDGWETLLYIVGLSIFFIMFSGLLINTFLPTIRIQEPLAFFPATISIHFLLYFIGLMAYFRNKDFHHVKKLKRPKNTNLIFYIIPIIFPILSALGATSINNGGTNLITMSMLGGIAIYVTILLLLKRKIDPNVYPFALFFISLAILLMTSLRGWYTTGHDNQQEYYVFLLTQSAYKWDIELFRDTYNACLSLNILPTILNSFIGISSLYIFKLIFQIIFALMAVAVYLLLKKYTTPVIAFFSAFFFISFPTFGNDMPMLNRQEIALFFFILSILVLFNQNLSNRLKNILFIIFSISMVVSHYSTSYLTTAILISVYFLSVVTKLIYRKYEIRYIPKINFNLTLFMVVATVLFTFAWNAVITETTSGFTYVMKNTLSNIEKAFDQDLKSNDTRYSIFSWGQPNKEELLADHVQEQKELTEKNDYREVYFSRSEYEKYPIEIAEPELLPLTSIGERLESINLSPYQINNVFKQGAAKLVQVLLLIGFMIMLFGRSKYYRNLEIEYLFFTGICILLLGVFILLPFISNQYGTLRLFQQTLIFLALPLIVGTIHTFSLVTKRFGYTLTVAFFMYFFLSLYGFIPEITGGFHPTLNLQNSGIYYNSLYTTTNDIYAVNWLDDTTNDVGFAQFQFDADSASRMLAYTQIRPEKNIIPSSIIRYSFVYLDKTNTQKFQSTNYFNGNSLTYKYPIEFLDTNKNLIYNNGKSYIYK